MASLPLASLGDVTRYAAIDEDRRLRTKSSEFHHHYDGADYSWRQVLAGAGASMLLGSFCTWLTLAGYSRVYYLAPISSAVELFGGSAEAVKASDIQEGLHRCHPR